MNNNTTWFEVFVTLGAGIVLLLVGVGLLSLTNPKIEVKCIARPGNVSSCLYPAK
jgi:hypothetical protein